MSPGGRHLLPVDPLLTSPVCRVSMEEKVFGGQEADGLGKKSRLASKQHQWKFEEILLYSRETERRYLRSHRPTLVAFEAKPQRC